MIPFFWKFHKVHHTDLDLDVSSGLRFHPFEILGSMLFKILVILALGPTPLTVMIFEAILNGMALFTHSNIKLPKKMDLLMRWFFVTPDMHRIHHSEEIDETNSNYGFNFSIWDRVLGTYIQEAQKPQSEKFLVKLLLLVSEKGQFPRSCYVFINFKKSRECGAMQVVS